MRNPDDAILPDFEFGLGAVHHKGKAVRIVLDKGMGGIALAGNVIIKKGRRIRAEERRYLEDLWPVI
jgi:hypothetical protein